MSSSVSTFFSKDAVMRPQTRFNRTRKNGTRVVLPVQIPGTSTRNPLDIIPEEGFDSMPTPASTSRAQRRHALSAAPKALRTTLEDIAEEPMVFTDITFNFPLPPLPTSSSCSRLSYKSPSSTSSSPPSSPDSQSPGLPLTPSTSDEDLPLPTLNPKRASIKPLVINKFQRPSTLPIVDRSEESDSEDSDSEWYTREFSKVLTLDSALPPISFPAAHRDSIFIAPPFDYCPPSLSPASERRRRRCSGLKYSSFDAPPVPPIPSQFLSPRCSKTLSITTPRRPPPRMSIPDDACSAFSLSLYTDDISESAELSPLSTYSQDSASAGGINPGLAKDVDGAEDVEFPAGFEVQMDCPMMLPLSLPGTPIDLEADFVQGLEELRMMKDTVGAVEEPRGGLGVGFILEEVDYEEEQQRQQHFESSADVVTPTIICTSPLSPLMPPSPPPPTAMPIIPSQPPNSPASTISAFSFPPSPCTPGHELSAAERDDFDERRYGLKSKWSSSTLASVREEHASLSSAPPSKFPGASKLKMYFQGQHKRNNGSITAPVSPKTLVPASTPMLTPVPALVSPSSIKGKGGKDKKEKKSKRESEDGSVLVIGYNNNNSNSGESSPRRSHDSYFYSSPTNSPSRRAVTPTAAASPRRSHELPPTPTPSPRSSPTRRNFGVRRSPSQSSAVGVSDCAGEESCASARSYWNDPIAPPSSGTLGLKRKPIPVEMFLRTGA